MTIRVWASRLGLGAAAIVLAALVPPAYVSQGAAPADADGHVLCAPPAPPPSPVTAAVAGGVRFRVVVPLVAAGEEYVPPPQPPDPPPTDPALLGLQASFADEINSYWNPGRFAIAVTDLQTGQTAGVDPDTWRRGGCLLNFFVILTATRDVQDGLYPLETVDALIRQTIWASDATAAHELYGTVGGGDVLTGVQRVNSLIHDVLHLDEVVLDHPPAFGESLGISDTNWVTAAAMNRALAQVYDGSILAPEWRDYLLEAMTHVKPGLNYLTATLPPEATVSHKNGFFWDWEGWVDNDTAIVRFESGGGTRAYAITFLSEAVPDLYSDIPLGQRLVQLAWAHFRSAYP